MSLSVLDIFKVGIGPSSSHTMGPMIASHRFLNLVFEKGLLDSIEKIKVELYGSLALTGIGHCTDKAVMLGLEGELPETIDPTTMDSRIEAIQHDQALHLFQKKRISFHPKEDLVFLRRKVLPLHANGMIFRAFDDRNQQVCSEIYYSIGGGHVRNEQEMDTVIDSSEARPIPFDFSTGEDLLRMGRENKLSVHEMMLANECISRPEKEVYARLDFIWRMMDECIQRGCQRGGTLPGKLKVRRRGQRLFQELSKKAQRSDDHLAALDWVNLYALAVNEENASGSKIVTAPTNGAAGIMPALIKYYLHFCKGDQEGVRRFLLTSGAIGILYAKNASISGAEVGCQGEVGVACSMAAGGLAAALGASNEQVEYAAEIGMEHNLGLTCDPIGGLVQIPCIERNAMGAVKAINAARIAMSGDGTHYVSLDAVMKTMMQTGADMKTKYKETSRGGLAVNIPEC